MKKLTIGSCFSGIGGLELGLEWTGGFETKWQIEMDEYASKVLEKHWPNVKRYSDIGDVIRPESVDLICGGFPCQDVSLAGKRAGLEGKRSTLWREMFRLICEVRPRWVVVENVPGLLSSDGGRFFGNILTDLASIGFNVEWGVLSAAGVGAPHLRERLFLMAYANFIRLDGSKEKWDRSKEWEILQKKSIDWNGVRGKTIGRSYVGGWWKTQPEVQRVADVIPHRVDRLKCLGNAVVPQVAQKIGEMILMAELKNYTYGQT